MLNILCNPFKPNPPKTRTLRGHRIALPLMLTAIVASLGATLPGPAVTASPTAPSFAGIWVKTGGPAWQARSGLTSGQYQTLFNQLVAQGYRPTDVNGYNFNGEARYAAIFEQSAGPAWQSRHGMTAAQYQATFDQLTNQGYRLTNVSGYEVNGQDYYAAIWQKVAGPTWQARHGMTGMQFQITFNLLVSQGYRLTDISGYSVNGQARYAAIFEQSPGPAWRARHGMTVDQFQTTFDQYANLGYRLVRVSGYHVNGQDRFAGIWQKVDGPAWQARHLPNSSQFQVVFDQLTSQGYRLVDMSGY
jgi:Bacterial tandem repeat domain 1